MAAPADGTTPFSPKQRFPFTAELYGELLGTVTEQVADHIFSNVLPKSTTPITPTSVIHDNGCAIGQVTASLMSVMNPPPTITVHCTDVAPPMVEGTKARIAKNGWKNVDAAAMPAQNLTFPDNYFTHSFTNFLFPHIKNEDEAARHLYRTLKDSESSVAVACTWKFMPHTQPVYNANQTTRGKEVALALPSPPDEFNPAVIRKILVSGGFDESKITIDHCTATHNVKDLDRWAAILWSYLGTRSDGWKTEDEEKWDQAIGIITDGIRKSEGYKQEEDGSVTLSFVANIARATK